MDSQSRKGGRGQWEEPLAYGDDHEDSPETYRSEEYPKGDEYNADEGEEDAEGERGIIGDTYRKFRGKPPKPGHEPGLGTFILDKLHDTVQDIGKRMDSRHKPSYTQSGALGGGGMHASNNHRFGSFAAQRTGNDVKWFVDGCGYFWAVSKALEEATHSIWILDWWLSPELYLRRPPSRNEQYRLDWMLQAAAQRGVKINVIVYKEVTQALTLDSAHTKHALEALHPNISVFRHPDHLPDAQTLQSSFWSSLQNIDLSAKTASTFPQDALNAIYGMNEDVVLYWAHHEKLCIIDGTVAFMGGLDLCYGRWDTNQHPIADVHPANLDDIVFPGQDYNNARIMDFQDVSHWQNNKVDRTESSRMGWSDISISLRGPVVEDLRAHFVERWNFIYKEKYDVRQDVRYSPLNFVENTMGIFGQKPNHPPPPPTQYQPQRPESYSAGGGGDPPLGQGVQYPPPPPGPPPITQGVGQYPPPPPRHHGEPQSQVPFFPPPPSSSSRNISEDVGGRGQEPVQGLHPRLERYEEEAESLGEKVRGRFEQGKQHVQDPYLISSEHYSKLGGHIQETGIPCQIVRSCSRWSHGVQTEHSIANAYISIIENSQHFIYIENQFFITATSEAQYPVKNKVGAAVVDRILRAARAGQKFKVIVIIPAVPGFAGDLRDDSALGTRAIMQFQYNSINRGGHSIMEAIENAGYNPVEYIRFYNLRNYDRINVSASMRNVEQRSGINYKDARNEHDEAVELPADIPRREFSKWSNYEAYTQTTNQMKTDQGLYPGVWDSVSECYMLGGRDIRSVPWENGDVPEIDVFVSEELYVHSKVLIADDRIAIVGSANLNDRSQLGYHDSEIAIIVEDPTPIDSSMNGRPHRASKFAATLRRQLFRKHLGLLKPQNMERADQNYQPVGIPNIYDFGSSEDLAVQDPLSETFLALWNNRAHNNTQVFRKVFHPVPDDSVLTWADYNTFYEHYFKDADEAADGKNSKKGRSRYMWGHVVAEEFSTGVQGVEEVKNLLATIKGTLVEMPLLFLIKEDIAQEGLSLNAFTKEVYT